MSSPFLGQILVRAIDGRPEPTAPDVPLEPIKEGAWAAWAQAARDEPGQPVVTPPATPTVSAARRWRLTQLVHHS